MKRFGSTRFRGNFVLLLSFRGTKKKVRIIEDSFNTTPNLTVVVPTCEVIIEAAEIRRDYKFRLPDAIQLATAIVSKAKLFVTNDRRLKKFRRVKVIVLSEV